MKTNSYIIAVDPGLSDLGLAVYKNKMLVYARHVKPLTTLKKTTGKVKMLAMAQALEQELKTIEKKACTTGTIRQTDTIDLVVEFAQAGGFMHTFLKMAFVAGVVVGRFGDRAEYTLPQGNQWKVSKEKEPTHKHFMARLNPQERSIVKESVVGLSKVDKFDVYDAVCIGQWFIEQQEV